MDNKDKAKITLKECIREIMGYDVKTRCKCFGFNEYCFKNSDEEFWECYFYIIDRINPRTNFKDFKNCFIIEMNATGKRDFKY